jgi:hypothetical protein
MHVNLVFGWSWMLVGMVAGMALGSRFQREEWLGGYASHPRRLLRLGHVSFIGLGILNVLVAGVAGTLAASGPWRVVASASLITGAVTMPLCCALMAWRRGLQPLFAVPVISLLSGVAVVVAGLLRP